MTNTTLVAKIAAASLKVGALATDKTNVQQRYDYISADKVLERAGDALATQGVVIFPSVISETTEFVTTVNGKSRYDATVNFSMIISDGESEMVLPWCGKGNDYITPDKATYKAITSGHKYFLMKLLNIGVGNEDGEHEEPQAAQDAKAPRRPAVSVTEDVDYSRQPDNPFDDAPAKPRITESQLTELAALGSQFYGDEWDKQEVNLATAVSKGGADCIEGLMASEATKLIEGIKKKMQSVAA